MYFNLPKRMINITKLVCVIGVVSVAFSSCLQKDVYDPANSGDKEEEVTLDNYFDFATTKNIQLNIDYGKECPRAYFEVYAENPLSYVAEGGQIIKKAGVSHIATGFTRTLYQTGFFPDSCFRSLYLFSGFWCADFV